MNQDTRPTFNIIIQLTIRVVCTRVRCSSDKSRLTPGLPYVLFRTMRDSPYGKICPHLKTPVQFSSIWLRPYVDPFVYSAHYSISALLHSLSFISFKVDNVERCMILRFFLEFLQSRKHTFIMIDGWFCIARNLYGIFYMKSLIRWSFLPRENFIRS